MSQVYEFIPFTTINNVAEYVINARDLPLFEKFGRTKLGYNWRDILEEVDPLDDDTAEDMDARGYVMFRGSARLLEAYGLDLQ